MGPMEILKLVAASVGLILGAIVFLVVFFRVMSWIDLWMRSGSRSRTTTPNARRSAARRRTVRSRRERPRAIRRTLAAKGFSEQRAVDRSVNNESSYAKNQIVDQSPGSLSPSMSSSIREQERDHDDHAVIRFDETRKGTVANNQEMMLHLGDSEIIGPVSIVSQDASDSSLQTLGMDASEFVVVRGRDDRTYAVRRSTINMVVTGSDPVLGFCNLES